MPNPYLSLSSSAGAKTTPDNASPDVGLSFFTVSMGLRTLSSKDSLDVSRTKDGLPEQNNNYLGKKGKLPTP